MLEKRRPGRLEGPRRRRHPRALPRVHEESIGRKAVALETESTQTRRPRIFYGWWIVLATFLVIVWGWGTFFYGFCVLFNPIRKEFGWSATTTALAFSLRSVEAGIAAPFVGILVDRLGPRRLMAFGVTVVGLGFLLMSQMQSLFQFYAVFFIISFGFSFATVGGIAVVNWFVKKRTFALAIQVSAVLPAGFIPPVIS
ncbi:MAG: MFS transporter [Dehalococcoidia bacterium]|nr:MFS transporter [Dehalococcoidia bacterium]